MTPESLVPSRSTCEALKAAGFPQETLFAWYLDVCDGYVLRLREVQDECEQSSAFAAPSAAELMEALPDHGTLEVWHSANRTLHACAYANVNSIGETVEKRHSNPAEALAQLWLAVAR